MTIPPIPPSLRTDPGCRLLEVDFSGIEAVLTMWFCQDPVAIRLAKLGVHAFLTGKRIGETVDLRQSDQDVMAHLHAIKAAHKAVYNVAKRVVHGTHYLLTPHGMARNFPEIFPSVAFAESFQQDYYHLVPTLKPWQLRTQVQADRQHYLGGPGGYPAGHPFGFKHWFWQVYSYRPVSYGRLVKLTYLKKLGKPTPEILTLHGKQFLKAEGDDAKRAVAFYPQSTAAGILYEKILSLFHPDSSVYIGDAFYGRTPLRAPIHDSLLLEIPVRIWDRVLALIIQTMTAPIAQLPIPETWRTVYPALTPAGLTIGVEAKAGPDWGDAMEEIDVRDLAWMPDQATSALTDEQRVWDGLDADDAEEIRDLLRDVVIAQTPDLDPGSIVDQIPQIQ